MSGRQWTASLTVFALVAGCGARTAPRSPVCSNDAFAVTTRLDASAARVDLFVLAYDASTDYFCSPSANPLVLYPNRAWQTALRTAMPSIQAATPHLRLGGAYYNDFPVSRYGDDGLHGGTVRSTPFTLVQVETTDVDSVLSSLDAVPTVDLSGEEIPSSQVEALYVTATGAGVGGTSGPAYVAAAAACPADRFGYPCFDPSAIGVILLLSSGAFHNGPTGDFPYDVTALGAPVHSYDEAVAALRTRHLRVPVVAFVATPPGRPTIPETSADDARALALATDAVDRAGTPIVNEVRPPACSDCPLICGPPAYALCDTPTCSADDGGRAATEAAIRDAYARTIAALRFDVSAAVRGRGAVPELELAGLTATVAAGSAEPTSGVEGIDATGTTFLQASSGTRLTFAVEVRGSFSGTRHLQVCYLGDGAVDLGCDPIDVINCEHSAIDAGAAS